MGYVKNLIHKMVPIVSLIEVRVPQVKDQGINLINHGGTQKIKKKSCSGKTAFTNI